VGANRFLDEQFLPDLNERFVVAAQSKTDLHRRVPRGVHLERVLAFQESRVVQNDWTVQWRGRWFQLEERERSARLARQRVIVIEQLDGRALVLYRNRVLTYHELPERPVRVKGVAAPRSFNRLGNKPAKDHPWRIPVRGSPPGPCSPGSAGPSSAFRLASRGPGEEDNNRGGFTLTPGGHFYWGLTFVARAVAASLWCCYSLRHPV
jgi:hypothetical protein